MPIYTGKRGRPRLTDAEKEARGWIQDDNFCWHPPNRWKEERKGWINFDQCLVSVHATTMMYLAASQLGFMGKFDTKYFRWSTKTRFRLGEFLSKFFGDLWLAYEIIGTLLYFKRDVRLTNYPGWSKWRKRNFEIEALATLAHLESRSPDPFPGLRCGPHEEPCPDCGGIGRVTRVRVPPPASGGGSCEVRDADQPPGLLGSTSSRGAGEPGAGDLRQDLAGVRQPGDEGRCDLGQVPVRGAQPERGDAARQGPPPRRVGQRGDLP